MIKTAENMLRALKRDKYCGVILYEGPSLIDGAPIVVIANRDVSITRLDRDSLRAIFAMRQRTWPDGQAVHVFVLPNDADVHAAFAKERLAVFPHQLQLAWDRMVFSGTGQAPHRIRTQQEMLEAIASTAGSIGYIAREYLDERVQVITRE